MFKARTAATRPLNQAQHSSVFLAGLTTEFLNIPPQRKNSTDMEKLDVFESENQYLTIIVTRQLVRRKKLTFYTLIALLGIKYIISHQGLRKLLLGAGVVAQPVKLPPTMPVQGLAAPVPGQPPANMPGKAVQCGPRCPEPLPPTWESWRELLAPAFGLPQPQLVWPRGA